MERNVYNSISKQVLNIFVEHNCTVLESENILRGLEKVIRETSTVQMNEKVKEYFSDK